MRMAIMEWNRRGARGSGLAVWRGILIAGITTVLVACSRGETASDPTVNATKVGTAKPALTVNVTQPATEDWPLVLNANGSIAAWQEASVGAEVGGLRIAELLANVGDTVKQGQVLARLSVASVEVEVCSIARVDRRSGGHPCRCTRQRGTCASA